MQEVRVLNHGHVRLIDHMGDDRRIAQAARVSYGGAEKTAEEDARLIDYLVRNEHTSPLEQVVFVFHLKLPIFVARQLARHRTARMNEISGRYVELPDEYWIPEAVRMQSASSKQSSYGSHHDAYRHAMTMAETCADAFAEYHSMISDGVAREQARAILPLGTYTEMVWQMDLHNLMHFIRLRLHPHAQAEIQVYAQAMLDLIRPICPVAIAAYERHLINSVRINAEEAKAIAAAIGAVELDERGKRILLDKLLTVL